MICTERGSKLVSAANYTVMSRHQSYDVVLFDYAFSSGDGHSVFIVVIVQLPIFHPAEESKYMIGYGFRVLVLAPVILNEWLVRNKRPGPN